MRPDREGCADVILYFVAFVLIVAVLILTAILVG